MSALPISDHHERRAVGLKLIHWHGTTLLQPASLQGRNAFSSAVLGYEPDEELLMG